SHQSSDWPWLHNVSTSQTPAKGEDYLSATQSLTNCAQWVIPKKTLCLELMQVWQTLNRSSVAPSAAYLDPSS
ncbi:hypothetical protein, partial [Rheinheimera sp.]|uniref:hypothetical protein n=1 Tax=Rheinheimera sp. TaxID=1869214 RepID=UPI004047A3B6